MNNYTNYTVYKNDSIHRMGTSGNYSTLRVLNNTGQIIYSESLHGEDITHKDVDISNYPPGSYTLQIVTDKNVISRVINKN